MNRWQVEEIAIESLIPYAGNARTHPDTHVAQVAASIEEFGFNCWAFYPENENYAATSCGKVLRVCREQKSKSGRTIKKYDVVVLNGSADRYGYLTYRILVKGTKKHVKGHRIVCASFYGKNDLPVNHKDGDKKNNQLSNLEYVTVAENNRHAIDNGLWKPLPKGFRAKVKAYDYLSIYLMIKFAGFSRRLIAQENSVSRQTIDSIYKKVDWVMSSLPLLTAA